MDTPIFAGKGVTAAIRHDRARRQRPQHNNPYMHTIWQCASANIAHTASMLMRNTDLLAIMASEDDIILGNGKCVIHVKTYNEW